MHATSRPIGLYHLHHPIVAMREAPRVVARAGATYGRGEILAIAVVELGIQGVAAEKYLGHKMGSLAAVSHAHYLRALTLKELRPIAERLDAGLRDALSAVRESPAFPGVFPK